MKHLFAISLMLVTSVTFLNCTSVSQLSEKPTTAGVSRTFHAGFNQVLKAARESIIEAGLMIESTSEINADTYAIIGRRPTNAWSWGEMVRVVVEKQPSSQTIVRVVTERKVKTNITARGDYSQSILSNIELKLKS